MPVGCYEYYRLGSSCCRETLRSSVGRGCSWDLSSDSRGSIDLEGFKEKSAEKLYEAIQASKENSAEKLLFGLGIRVGSKVSQILLQEFHDLDQLATAERIASIDSLGMVVAESLKVILHKKDQASLARAQRSWCQ